MLRGTDLDTAWMQGEHNTTSLNRYLDELADLLPTLVRGGNCGVAIYDGSGTLLAKGGDARVAFAPRIRMSVPEKAGESARERHARAAAIIVEDENCASKTAYAFTGSPERDGRRVFAVSAALEADPHVLRALCELGAWFLSRELSLVDQASRLRQLAQEQEAIIDHISDGLLMVDRSGHVRYMNAAAGRILSLDPGSSVGRKFRDLLDFEPIIEPIFTTGRGYIDREMQIDSPRRHLHLIDTAIPIRNEEGEVVSIVNTFREISRVRRLSQRMIGDQARYRFSDITGTSKAIRDTISAARRAARSDANVLLYGESGTGKELFAQAIHGDGRRKDGPFVAINCSALPRDLIESELFGYVAGSFTGADSSGRAGKFELASGGTILLDEISEMPLDVQAKLLRVLQERQVTRIGGTRSVAVDVRIIAAANHDLREGVTRKTFREDLYYRLNVIRLDVPPLRDRPEDIERLFEIFLQRYCATLQRTTLTLTTEARRQLLRYKWPGNVRQLQNLAERLVNMVDGDVVEAIPTDWLSDEVRSRRTWSDAAIQPVMSLEESERACIRLALKATGCNVTKASEILGITRPTLYSKMKRYNLSLSVRLADLVAADPAATQEQD